MDRRNFRREVHLHILLLVWMESQSFEPLTLIPLGMLIFSYLLVTGGFKYESVKLKKYLSELFESDIENKKRIANNR